MNYRCYQIALQSNIFPQIRGDTKCSPDIYYWGAGLAVTGRIWNIGQNVLQSPLQTRGSSSPSYFHIVFLIAFLEEAFIRKVIILLYRGKIFSVFQNRLGLTYPLQWVPWALFPGPKWQGGTANDLTLSSAEGKNW